MPIIVNISFTHLRFRVLHLRALLRKRDVCDDVGHPQKLFLILLNHLEQISHLDLGIPAPLASLKRPLNEIVDKLENVRF